MKKIFFLILVASTFFMGCEEEFTPDIPVSEPEIVVEGIIEAGDRSTPPYIILTRSVPFFTDIGADELEDIFVHHAEIKVSEGNNEVLLSELCLDDLTSDQIALASDLFGIDLEGFSINFCVYTDFTFSMIGEEGKTYDLTIEIENQIITSTTSIPRIVPLDSLVFEAPPGEPNDTLMQLTAFLTDPSGEPNFYRYFTQVNDEPLFPGFPSSADDRLFDGQSFQFPLPKAISRETNFEDIDLNTTGLYLRGDTVTIKWATMDEIHHDFWNTLEFNAANSGPFSTYTRVESNVNGALGIWGGYNASYRELIVPIE